MCKDKETGYSENMNQMIEERILIMEDRGYRFGKRFRKRDYLITMAVITFCLVALIVGAYL